MTGGGKDVMMARLSTTEVPKVFALSIWAYEVAIKSDEEYLAAEGEGGQGRW